MNSSAPDCVLEAAGRAGVVDAMQRSIALLEFHDLKGRRTPTGRATHALVRVEPGVVQQVDYRRVQQNFEPLSRCHFSVPPGSSEPHGLRTAR